ncbi:uncharacterized protein ASCRUDRAFT_67394 [Ascoidea rubescens DSM 1968]|uniref:Velvet domain-containing protein n=1 Tax=Ascoidea rubescens DSM 1968 TaxID=1344418 RepID=A0A1D2VNS5_9ASCO|nr:hypothetical protein ASCRUDRAFT_67394 [Ascoidea rubescens DSM 1968]ODV63272.1 hypothetical protein ASCRUDRAFT_67394 [Ascoidea rubescens DSM 1968]
MVKYTYELSLTQPDIGAKSYKEKGKISKRKFHPIVKLRVFNQTNQNITGVIDEKYIVLAKLKNTTQSAAMAPEALETYLRGNKSSTGTYEEENNEIIFAFPDLHLITVGVFIIEYQLYKSSNQLNTLNMEFIDNISKSIKFVTTRELYATEANNNAKTTIVKKRKRESIPTTNNQIQSQMVNQIPSRIQLPNHLPNQLSQDSISFPPLLQETLQNNKLLTSSFSNHQSSKSASDLAGLSRWNSFNSTKSSQSCCTSTQIPKLVYLEQNNAFYAQNQPLFLQSLSNIAYSPSSLISYNSVNDSFLNYTQMQQQQQQQQSMVQLNQVTGLANNEVLSAQPSNSNLTNSYIVTDPSAIYRNDNQQNVMRALSFNTLLGNETLNNINEQNIGRSLSNSRHGKALSENDYLYLLSNSKFYPF